jgi:hypothetical protein
MTWRKGEVGMNILENMLSAGGGGVVKQLANQFGIGSEQATSAISALVPALAGGLKEKLASGSGSEISDLLSGGSFTRFAENPSSLATPAALEQGKSLVNRIFGSGDLTSLVSVVAEKSGISTSVVSNMLPIAATLLGTFIAKNTTAGNKLTDVVGQFANAGHSGVLSTLKGLISKVA